MAVPYYTTAGGVKTPFPVPVHHHDNTYVTQNTFANLLRPYAGFLLCTTTWSLPNNTDVSIGANAIAGAEWESDQYAGSTDIVSVPWTAAGFTIPRTGAYYVSAVVGTTNPGVESARFVLSIETNGNTGNNAPNTIQRAHSGNSFGRSVSGHAVFAEGDRVSVLLKTLAGQDVDVSKVVLGIHSLSPALVP